MKAGIIISLLLYSLWAWRIESRNVFVAAPNMFRIGTQEKIGLAIDGIKSKTVMEIYVQDYPGKKRNFSHATVTLTPGQPEIANLTIHPGDVEDIEIGNPNSLQYVNLVAHGVQFHQEALIPLSVKSGYIFLQTDKPIYTPKQKVQIRIIGLNEDAKPMQGKFRLQIRNPNDVVVRDTLYGEKQQQAATVFQTPEPFPIPAHSLCGNWSALVLYGYKFQQNTSVPFEVEKYVLPTFTVKLQIQDVILKTDPIIPIIVHARYLYGKPVKGIVSFRLGIKGPAPETTIFGIANSKELAGGDFTLNINTDDLKRHKDVGWFPKIEGFHFYVEATVIDFATAQKEVVFHNEAIFTSSPLLISFKRSLKDFKPGLMSVIEADLTYVSGRPAVSVGAILTGTANRNLPLRIYTNKSTSDDDGRIWFDIHPELHHTVINVEVKTDDPKYGDMQTVGRHMQKKFTSKRNAYIAINRRSREIIQPGSSFSEDVYIENSGTPMTDIYFLVSSRGKILRMGKLPHGQFRNPRVEFPVTYEMAPSFRIVVFGHCNGELIADSRRVDVANKCDPKAKVDINPDFSIPEPTSNGKIILRGSKGTLVGLLGVDSGVYALSNQGLLTNSKMFKTLGSHDLGCGAGGGLTTNGVLGNAGVVIFSNLHAPSQYSEFSCKERIRKKRSFASDKLQKYTGKEYYCCSLAMEKNPHNRTCQERWDIVKPYLKEIESCSKIFLHCCDYNERKDLGGLLIIQKKPGDADLIILTDEEEADIEKNINIRKEFRETWLFNDIFIGVEGQAVYDTSLPHSITTWVIQAVSLSPSNGMCVADPKEQRVMKNVFLQLNLPYSVVRNEQIEIKATVFNYRTKRISASVYLYGTKDLCTGLHEDEMSGRKRIFIDAYSAQTVYFPIIPLKVGNYDIKVSALTADGSDIIIRQLNVVPEGHPVEKHIVIALDPSNQQKRIKREIITDTHKDNIDAVQKLQVTAVNLNLPEDSVPGTETCVVTAIGNQFGPTVETCLKNPESLMLGPAGCAEQTIIRFAPTMYTIRYLKSTGQITPANEEKGYDFIRKGYGHQLTFRKADGSFGTWINTPSSVWLTAFVTRVFCQASEFVHIDQATMCAGVSWLVNKQNFRDGSFKEDNPVYHKNIVGGVKGKEPLTAFVFLTLKACQCDIDVTLPKERAVQYLENKLDTVRDPLPTAIVTYALSLSNSNSKYAANDKLLALKTYNEAANTLYWLGSSKAASIETTSYALLAQLRLNDMGQSNSIVNWLNTQRLSSGQFQSTQDTVVALNALSEYAIKAKLPAISLTSNLTISNDKDFYKIFNFNEKNALSLQEAKVGKVGGILFVHTSGYGVGSLGVKLRYNMPTPPEKLRKFDLSVNVSVVKEEKKLNGYVVIKPPNADVYPDTFKEAKQALDKPPEEESEIDYSINSINLQNKYQPLQRRWDAERMLRIRSKREDKNENRSLVLNVTICVMYLGDHEVGMSIVDAGVFSGFIPIEDDLKKLVKDKSNQIDRYELLTKGVVFYLGTIPRKRPFCFSFRIMQDFIVGNTQTSVIRAYDYYNPDESCTVFYSPDNNSPMLRKICSDGICQCAEGGCPPKNPFLDLKRSDLLLMACEKHDYVWRGSVASILEKKDGFMRIQFTVQEVFKEGIEKTSMQGEVRTLFARDNCESAKLVLNREYIIMGKDGEKHKNEEGKIWYRYLLDKLSKIQMWISNEGVDDSPMQRHLTWLGTTLKTNGCEL